MSETVRSIKGPVSFDVIEVEAGFKVRFTSGLTVEIDSLESDEWAFDFLDRNIVLIEGERFRNSLRNRSKLNGEQVLVEKYQSESSSKVFLRVVNPFLNGFSLDGVFDFEVKR